jgi:hypothetical protein
MLRLLFSYSFNLTERRSAIARHPDASSLDAAIQLTAAAMLLKEGQTVTSTGIGDRIGALIICLLHSEWKTGD